jgi:hypothetical protein
MCIGEVERLRIGGDRCLVWCLVEGNVLLRAVHPGGTAARMTVKGLCPRWRLGQSVW